ncbi:hypothetical protein GCM10009001_36050 [Virgibacillus siamensis]|uniref:Uncharacterized protein n=1 Tax=Virgibacillus siamensis TaxID=480071 RepID=A0ABN1GP85_9BACI
MYNKKTNLSNPKMRDIFYAGHMDGKIFKYYGEMLNNRYNDVCEALRPVMEEMGEEEGAT